MIVAFDYNQIAQGCLDAPAATTWNTPMLDIVMPVAAYLIGSISSAVLVARAFGLQDPRTVGSGNPGATNILRYGSRKAAIITLVGDILKGVIAVVIARLLTDDPRVIAFTMMAVIVGHMFPVFFRFQGGKGVATAVGAYIAASPLTGAALIVTWLVVAVLTRYSSLSALVATALSPLFVWTWLRDPAYLIGSIVIGVLLFWRHRENIRRLANGTETKIGQK
jgi:glycerol-3-phosphate acyltransferase PlsY